MKILVDLLSTDYGLMSFIVIAVILLVMIWAGRLRRSSRLQKITPITGLFQAYLILEQDLFYPAVIGFLNVVFHPVFTEDVLSHFYDDVVSFNPRIIAIA